MIFTIKCEFITEKDLNDVNEAHSIHIPILTVFISAVLASVLYVSLSSDPKLLMTIFYASLTSCITLMIMLIFTDIKTPKQINYQQPLQLTN